MASWQSSSVRISKSGYFFFKQPPQGNRLRIFRRATNASRLPNRFQQKDLDDIAYAKAIFRRFKNVPECSRPPLIIGLMSGIVKIRIAMLAEIPRIDPRSKFDPDDAVRVYLNRHERDF